MHTLYILKAKICFSVVNTKFMQHWFFPQPVAAHLSQKLSFFPGVFQKNSAKLQPTNE